MQEQQRHMSHVLVVILIVVILIIRITMQLLITHDGLLKVNNHKMGNPSYGPTFGNGNSGDISIPDRFDVRAGSSNGLAYYSSTYAYISSMIRNSWIISDVEAFRIIS
jgi:hypothetical protein